MAAYPADNAVLEVLPALWETGSVSQSPYGNETSDQVNFYGQPVDPQPQPAPVDFGATSPDYSYPSYADPAQPDPGYVDPASYSYAQPGVGYATAPTYNALTPYVATGYHYYQQPEHPAGTSSLVWGLLGMFVFPPLAYVALGVASRGRSEMQAEPGRYRDGGQLTAGWILGIIGSVLCSLYILMGLLFLAFMLAL